MSPTEIPAGYWQNGRGELVPEANIRPLDRLRDELVKALHANAAAESIALALFKKAALSEVDAFLALSAAEYGVSLGGKKGNVTLYSYDQKLRLTIQIGERLAFDERLQTAKALIDECIREWGSGARAELMTLINDAFQVDKQGQVSTARVLGLRRHDIKDDKWVRAMQAISDSVLPVGSTRYMRFHERVDDTDTWRPILLDFAAV